MKRDARETNAKTNNIITVDIAGASDGVLAKIGKVDAIRRDVRRQRVLNMEYPPIPDNTIFEIADPFNVSSTGESFLHYDNCRDNRIIIFETIGSLDFLQNSEHWFMDGTFSTVPPQFLQSYTVHGFQQGRNGIGAYSLLTNNRLETYSEFLTLIQILTKHVNPHSITVDFEQAMIGALRNVYPLVPQKGCLFHLSKNIYRKVQDLGLLQLNLDDEQFRTNIRMIAAISFLPIEDTIQEFEVLGNHAGNNEQPILDYFETTYIWGITPWKTFTATLSICLMEHECESSRRSTSY